METEVAGPLILVLGAILGAVFTDALKHRSEIRLHKRSQLEALIFGLGEIRAKYNALFGAVDLTERYRELSASFFRANGIARMYCPQAYEPLEKAAWEVSMAAKALASWVDENPRAPAGVTPRHLTVYETRMVAALALADKAALNALANANRLPAILPIPDLPQIVTTASRRIIAKFKRRHVRPEK